MARRSSSEALARLLAGSRRAPLRILCIGAHPDDIEIGCGGTLLNLIRRRPAVQLRWIVLSGSERRAQEARRGAAAFGGRTRKVELSIHSLQESHFPAQYAELKTLLGVEARRKPPDVVLTHHRDDLHQDHRIVAELTWNAFRDHLVLEYEIPKWDGDLGRPNVYVPLSRRTLDRKIRLLERTFVSQRPKDWFDPGTFRGLARIRGMECRSPSGYAEAFYGRKLTLALGG